MFRRLILTLTLAFLFGIGQQGVIAHQISHLDDLAPASHQQDKSAHSVCDECVGHSALAFAIGVAQFKPYIAKSSFEPLSYLVVQSSSRTLPTYLARAPPQFI